MRVLFLLALLPAALIHARSSPPRGRNWQGYVKRDPSLLSDEDFGEVPLLPNGDVPQQWMWDNVNGINYLTLPRNQVRNRIKYCNYDVGY
jgi:hypothetical protein